MGIAHDVDVAAVKLDTGQMVVGAEFVKPAQVVTEQRELGAACALGAGDEMHFSRHERGMFVGRQGIQGFSDDLRCQAADG